MTTGRIDPDYKSEKPNVRISRRGARSVEPFEIVRSSAGRREITAQARSSHETQRARLRDAVVEAATLRRRDQNAMFQQGTQSACDVFTAADSRFECSLTALLEFEAKQDQK